MKQFGFTFAAMALSGLAAAAGGGGDDLKAMQGSWAVTITETNGKAASKEEMSLKLVIIVAKDGYRLLADGKQVGAGTLKLDPSKTPRTLDAFPTEGPTKGLVQKGIYEIKDDTMTLVFAKAGRERPTEFKTKEGSEQSVLQYVRMKS